MQLRINFKGILKAPVKFKKKDIITDKFLTYVGVQGQRAIKRRIDQLPWKRSTGKMKRSIKWERGPSSVTWYSDLHYTEYQNYGVRPHQMDYLLKAKRPIPLELPDGKLVFRWATQQSMNRGAWQHPGFPGKKFFEYGRERVRQLARNKLLNNSQNYVKKLMK